MNTMNSIKIFVQPKMCLFLDNEVGISVYVSTFILYKKKLNATVNVL